MLQQSRVARPTFFFCVGAGIFSRPHTKEKVGLAARD